VKIVGVAFATIAMLIIAGLLSGKITVGAPPPDGSMLAVGRTAPPISVVTTAGKFNLESVTKPVFLEVLATWCPHFANTAKGSRSSG
jgi:hypothetical protein